MHATPKPLAAILLVALLNPSAFAQKSTLANRPPDRQYLFHRGTHVAGREGAVDPAHQSQAKRLWERVDTTLEALRSAEAVQLLHEILYFDSQDERARRALGLNSSQYRVPVQFEAKLARNPQHAYGWPAARYWRLQTEHFYITTNHSPEAAEQLGELLEEFHTVWRQLFVGFLHSPEYVRQAIRGRGLSQRQASKHRVVLFRSKQEYVSFLRRIEPQADMTLGIYRDMDRAAYFYAGEDGLERTWRHEVAHQLFFESTRRTVSVGQEHNFWLVEGIALYLESLQKHDGYYTVGGIDAERLQFARYRALNERFYVPLEEFSRLGRVEVQLDPRIRRLYSQAAGLTHFLMDGAEGRYREPTIELLKLVYEGSDREDSLAEILGISFEKLDRQYREFLQVDDRQVLRIPAESQPRMLSLGNTNVTDRSLMRLGRMNQLMWLDLANCRISDGALGLLAPSLPLRRLNLEGTGITDVAGRHLARFRDLAELDLSSTGIGDEGCVPLVRLKQLRSLWLTETRVTNQSLSVLGNLPSLQLLDVGNTMVTADAWRGFLAAHPSVNREQSKSNPE